MLKKFPILSIIAITMMVPANAQYQSSLIGWDDHIIAKLNHDNPYVIYDDNARSAWDELNQLTVDRYEDGFYLEYQDRFYGQDIIIKNDDKGYLCSTPNPTLFWESLLIRSKGDSVKCILQDEQLQDEQLQDEQD